MKNLYGYLSVFLVVILLFLPLIPGKSEAVTVNTVPIVSQAPQENFKVKNDNNEIVTLSAKEYVMGVVSAEMPASYHEEALKAQAVAAYTFALYRKEENKDKEYDITTDSSVDQAYASVESCKKKWGDNYDEYHNKIEKAVNSVMGKKITYNGKTALSVYFSLSGGKTESAKNLWGKDIPYLVPTESVGDMLSPDYLSNLSLSEKEIIEQIPEIKDVPYKNWFSSPKYSDSGTVLSMTFGEKVIDGKTIREKLNLKSANFDVSFENEKFNFTVRGYGHHVGMSQYGANYMALQGSTFEEILNWYYKGCQVS